MALLDYLRKEAPPEYLKCVHLLYLLFLHTLTLATAIDYSALTPSYRETSSICS